MRHSTLIFNRQVLRLCKGILKAWEQWVDEMEYEDSGKKKEVDRDEKTQNFDDKDREPYRKIVNH